MQNGDNFKAEISVPVWTSQLFISDWWLSAERPLDVTVLPDGNGWRVTVINRLPQAVTNVALVVDGRIFELGGVGAGQTKQSQLGESQGRSLRDYVKANGSSFQGVVQARQQAFGAAGSGRINAVRDGCVAASFLSELGKDQPQGAGGFEFLSPPGLDLSSLVERGQAVLLAWSPDFSPAKPMNLFTPRRSHRDTLWRVAVSAGSPGSF